MMISLYVGKTFEDIDDYASEKPEVILYDSIRHLI